MSAKKGMDVSEPVEAPVKLKTKAPRHMDQLCKCGHTRGAHRGHGQLCIDADQCAGKCSGFEIKS